MKHSLIFAFLGITTANGAVNAHDLNSIPNESNKQNVGTHVAGFSSWMQNNNNRKLVADDLELACDQSFFKCMPVSECAKCFMELKDGNIDWATVTDDTPCESVIQILFEGGHCGDMKGKSDVMDIFCSTYNVCVPWYRSQNKDKVKPGANNTDGDKSIIDCSTLTECNWDDFHRGFIGDGICHENYPGCYNTEICNYDGGDCCEDKCQGNKVAECGHDGFACRDPSSKKCDSSLTKDCKENDDDNDDTKPDDGSDQDCETDETKYRLIMSDSFGYGWDTANIVITESKDKTKVIFSGGLESGSSGTKYICLSSSATCYDVQVTGGIWGNEVSWEIRPLSEGARALADGASPMDCIFSVAGDVDSCSKTCSGTSNADRSQDNDFKTYADLKPCIEEKCLIQNKGCEGDDSCKSCLTDKPSEFCFAKENFNALIGCTMCQCTNDKFKDFCASKSAVTPVTPPKKDQQPGGVKECTAVETLSGSNALMTFAGCSNFDEVGMMVTDFDTNNFGDLDTFEACAHSYNNDASRGGRTAMGCMQILYDSMNSGDKDDDDDINTSPNDAIAALARSVYDDGRNFCDCASKSSDECPLCNNFIHLKTLLYEALDACKALDEIDCAAWAEFHPKCKTNLKDEFENVDFKQKTQCDYVKDNCGDAGPLPALRRKFDCVGEIPKASSDFYNMYKDGCLGDDDADTTPATPAPTPPTAPNESSTTPVPTQKPTEAKKPYIPEGGKPSKQYVPSDDDEEEEKTESKSSEIVETSHFWRNILIMGLLGGSIYVYYKRNNDAFSFSQYGRAPRNYGVDGNTLYSGLSMDGGASNFEPPSLPGPPPAMNNQYHQQQHMGHP